MSEITLKQTLRKVEFPTCAKEALNKIGELICGRTTSIKNMDSALDLMSEFVFCETDRRGNKRHTQLKPLQELQLLEILVEYFTNVPSESARNTVFLSLFSGTTVALRSSILSKLVSIAVGIPSSPILLAASAWMQQLGNTSVNSCKLAESLVNDYFHLYSNPLEKLKDLPNIAPQFTANFLTALAENYFSDDDKKSVALPSQKLLETITFWICENSTLCVAAQQRQAVLPSGAIAMEATTPIAGLLHWCIVAPIYQEYSDLYCRLHLALLHSILEIPVASPPKAVCAQHLTTSVRSILLYRKQSNDVPQDCLQLALDRYAQSIQVALCVNCVYGKIDELILNLEKLPYNKLLSIVVNTHKQIK